MKRTLVDSLEYCCIHQKQVLCDLLPNQTPLHNRASAGRLSQDPCHPTSFCHSHLASPPTFPQPLHPASTPLSRRNPNNSRHRQPTLPHLTYSLFKNEMSREGYTVPTQGAANPFEPARYQPGGQSTTDNDPTIRYLCGDCGSPNSLKKSQPVTCLDCGCRVLYKERTKRSVALA